MGTENEGFPDEPTFSLAALTGQEQLHERIRELENERAQVAADLRVILSSRAVTLPGSGDFANAWNRLSAVAWPAAEGPGHAEPYRAMARQSQEPTDALSATEHQP
jgi:hypothetical protein